MLVFRDDDHSQCCLNRTGLKTRIAIVVSSLAVHILRGSLFTVPEDYNAIYDYPNLGSLAFVLAMSLYSMTLCLHPKSLCIQSEAAQCVFKIILVILITNVLLVFVWQILINLTVELVLILHDILLYLNLPSRFLIDYMVSYYLGHVEALVILGWVVSSLFTTDAMTSSGDESSADLTLLDDEEAIPTPSASSGSLTSLDSYYNYNYLWNYNQTSSQD
ncbi:uncharacterized protein LOC113473803 [Diaphorina citri]|uniref:Uncharacterized protein LOC113473803 n=1 Tax=Diaphorina citri TaxID=121845 RepID=A0A3Q0JKW9_DIACI|nr:uncharacterized protein LOC113473803 [Diaphorina citri]KAI5698831.1 hypothetical protein M8J75_012507 [Diaphorina citri]KAI5723948.1 hypothetical protein M8J76_013163 [Diaphorina citri]KAI5728331.1 hypothetical protein M8J77_014767 [Diaphorina citri]